MIKIQHKLGMEWRLRETLKAFKVEKIYTTTEDRTLAIEELPKNISLEEIKGWTTVDKVTGDKPKVVTMGSLLKLIGDYNKENGNKDNSDYELFMCVNGGNEATCCLSKGKKNVKIDKSMSSKVSYDVINAYIQTNVERNNYPLVNGNGEQAKDMKISNGKIVFTF